MSGKNKNFNVFRVAIDLSSDTLTPVLAYLRLARAGHKAFLLESVEGGERLGRYSFLGIDPRETLRVRNGVANVERDGGPAGKRGPQDKHKGAPTMLPGNPFHAIGDYLARYRAEALPGLPPFQGGAIGYLGYECASYLEKIPVRQAGSTNGSDTIDEACIMVFGNIVAFDHVKRRVFVISNVFTDEESRTAGTRRATREAYALKAKLFARTATERGLEFPKNVDRETEKLKFSSAMGRRKFVAAVKKVKEHIRAGDIFQCVLSDQFTLPVKADPFSVYRALQAVNPSPYLFYLSFGKDALLGASPEMLTRADAGNVISTCPIAGTRPRGKDDAEDKKLERQLLASIKERAEHVMLVDLGRNDIGRVATPGTVNVKDFMQVQRFSHVMHLVSLVQGKLRADRTPWDALASCFPAGTLSGAPKIRAMQIIAEHEPVRRNAYGGAVIYSDFAGHLDSCITIRSLFVKNGKGYAQAGAGIVADSNPDMEYREVLHKFRAVRRAVAIANATAATGRAQPPPHGAALGRTP